MKRISTSSSSSSSFITVIPKRLSFTVLASPPKRSTASTSTSTSNTSTSSGSSRVNFHYFSVENDPEFQYQPFYADFGPLSLLQLHKFLGKVRGLLDTVSAEQGPLCFYCSPNPISITNSIFLVAAFSMIHNGVDPDRAFRPFKPYEARLKPFRDASSLSSLYDLSVVSCLRGVHRAIGCGWFDPAAFDAAAWARYELVENGDMNWLIPGKLMAFASPYSTNVLQGGWKVVTPKELVPVFKSFGITRVVRLCNKLYDESIFTKQGLNFTELFFEDGTIPPERILNEFLELMASKDVIALHCKAGLGRTGTLAACYMIKNYSFTPDEAIGWIRVCRPGSIIGPQQRYLFWYENELKNKIAAGETPKAGHTASPSKHLRTTFQEAKAKSTKSSHPPSSSTASGGSATPTRQTRTSALRADKNAATAQSLTPQRFSDFRHLYTATAVPSMAQDDSASLSITALQLEAKKAQPRKKKRALSKRENL